MPIESSLTLNPAAGLLFQTGVRRGLHQLGEMIAELSNSEAPYEPQPRHGVHMIETVFVRLEIDGAGMDVLVVGYTAFWAIWQHEDLDYHHERGEAKFLERALLALSGRVMPVLGRAVEAGMT